MSKGKQKYKLDLHGVFHSEVFGIVDEYVGNCIIHGINEFEIVTGYSKEMKKLVQEVLSDYKLKGESPLHNKGTLVVKYDIV